LIESGGCGVQRRKSWGASHRSVGCIFLFAAIIGVQFPDVMDSINPRSDHLILSDLMQFL